MIERLPITLKSLICEAIKNNIQPGQCFEVHLDPDRAGETTHMGLWPVRDFIGDWGYALLGRQWNEPIDPHELPRISRRKCYVGIVHSDGACLFEI